MNVLILDDHQLVGIALQGLLAREWSSAQIQAFSNQSAALSYLEKDPNLSLVLSDLNLGGQLGGLEFIEKVRQKRPATPILVLSMHADQALANKSMSLGANGYVVKSDPPEEIFTAIRACLAGKKYCSPGVNIIPTKDKNKLTLREQEVAALVATGSNSREIAAKLSVSTRTVEVHRRNIMLKLGAKNVAQMIAKLSEFA